MANTRIPYASTLQLGSTIEAMGMTQMIPAAGNPALPPQSTTTASAQVPLNSQFATASVIGYPVRGEK